MSNAPHITYLFGAGASYNSMPVVSELNNDLKKWGSLASDRYANDKAHRDRFLNEVPELRLKFIRNHVTPVVGALDGFATVDTLARFYTLRKKSNELYTLKKVIDTYFFFRQFGGEEASIMSDNSTREVPKQVFDGRYDSLFAAILTEDCQLPSNVSILSWNYDLEVERSLAKFRNNEAYDNFAHVYHINGRCTPVVRPRTSTNAKAYGTLNFAGGNEINYAWERPDEVKSEINRLLAKTTHLVLIGYSFPVFNREIDRQILAAPNLEKIYIQDLPKALPGIENRVKALLGQRANYAMRDRANEMSRTGVNIGNEARKALLDLVEIETIDSVDQFHIPFELI